MNRRFHHSAFLTALVAISILSGSEARAQEELSPDQFFDSVNQLFNQVVNGATLFTSKNSFASGYFVLDSGDGDTKVNLLRLPGRYTLGDGAPGEQFTPFLTGSLSMLKVTESVVMDDEDPTKDFSVIESLALEGGVGVDIHPLEHLTITPEVSVAYNRLENRYDFNSPFSQLLIQPLFDEVFFNWELDVLTYSPSIQAAYEFELCESTVTPFVRYTYLYNDSVSSSSEFIDINSESWFTQTGVNSRIPLGVSLWEAPLSFQPFFIRTDFGGDASRGLGFNHFHEVGFDVGFGTEKYLSWLNEMTLGGSYSFGRDFEGWRIGLGYKF